MSSGAPAVVSALEEQAYEALRLAHADPQRARKLAGEVLASTTDDAGARSVAAEALGLAAKELHDLDAAVSHLRQAVNEAERAHLETRAARARTNLSFVLLARGDTRAALREVDRAAEVLRGREAARLAVRRALVLQRLGRLDDALAGYQEALPLLRRTGDRLWEARLLSNRGVLQAYRSEFAAAEQDLLRAVRLHDELGQTLAAAQVRHNLGFVAGRRGDLPAALTWFDDADRRHRNLGIIDWVGLADRCELLLSARLLPEARALATRAVDELGRAGMDADLAEARLTLATAALLQGDHASARRGAEQAQQAFRRQGREAWTVLAGYTVLRAKWQGGVRTPALYRSAVTVADALTDAGWTLAGIDAHLLAARTALELGRLPAAEGQLKTVRAARRRGPVELQARAWHAEALARLARGNRRGADAALRAGMRAFDRHQVTLGATELRVHVAGHVGELAQLGTRLAIESQNPRRVLRWAERWRGGGLRLAPVRPPADEQLAADLATLRDVAAEIDQTALAGQDTRGLLRRQGAIERAIQARSRHVRGDGGAGAGRHGTDRVDCLDRIAPALDDRAMVEMVRQGDHLHAVVVADGRARLRHLGAAAEVVHELDRLRVALRRLTHPHGAIPARETARRSAAVSAQRLDDRLFGPLRADVGDRPLVVIPSGALHAVPWSLLPSCSARAVSVAPSAELWYRATLRSQEHIPSDRVALVGCTRPPHAVAEVLALHDRYPQASVLTSEHANVAAVTAAMDGADLVHLACHGRFRSDNPLFSSLQLADGPLTVYDLERMARPSPLLVLSACESGLSDVQPGDELMGLAAALLSLGTATLIASVVPVPDAATRRLMVAFHDHLGSGCGPAQALAQAQAAGGALDEDLAAAAGFVCLGAG